jgi:hypothetical protein
LSEILPLYKVADCLTNYGMSVVSSGSRMFMGQVPAFVSHLVSGDLELK